MLIFHKADGASRPAAAQIETDSWKYRSLPVRPRGNAIVQAQVEHLHIRRLPPDLRIMIQEVLHTSQKILVAHDQFDCPAFDLRHYDKIFRRRRVHFRNVFPERAQFIQQPHHGLHALAAFGFGLLFGDAAQHGKGKMRLRGLL